MEERLRVHYPNDAIFFLIDDYSPPVRESADEGRRISDDIRALHTEVGNEGGNNLGGMGQ